MRESGMPRLLNNSAHWHLRAQEAQLLAAQLEDPVAKAATLKIAEEYERLAARAAKRVVARPKKREQEEEGCGSTVKSQTNYHSARQSFNVPRPLTSAPCSKR
jgi:hypothetical protein